MEGNFVRYVSEKRISVLIGREIGKEGSGDACNQKSRCQKLMKKKKKKGKRRRKKVVVR